MAEGKEKTDTTDQQAILCYSPSAIVNIFNNALNNNATRIVMKARGIYTRGRGTNYNGYYYDQLKEESSDACITLIVPALMRPMLMLEQVIECHVYLTKKVQPNGARIELQLNMMQLLSQRENAYSEEQIKAVKVIQRKVEAGYKDVDAFVKTKSFAKNR